jgi:lycopene cyclase domain-containing protein
MLTSSYLLLNVFTLAGPLARSFEPRVRFASRWPALAPAIAVTGALFVAWDVLFTRLGVWGFNEAYLVGLSALGLPLEEWLFFLTVPYACVFIYDCLNYFWPMFGQRGWARYVSLAWGAVAACLAVVFHDRLYTAVTCGLSAVCMGFAYWRNPPYLGGFFRAFAVALIPFFVVNGALTGAFTSDPIVWYDNQRNMGVRLGTIPLEDAFYLLPLLWLVIAQYEWHMRRLGASRALRLETP